MRTTLALLLLVLLATPLFAAGFPLLEGPQQAAIVYEDTAKAETIKAYEDLASYLKKATGKDFKVLSDTAWQTASGGLPIYVGRCGATKAVLHTEISRLDRDAYIINVEPRQVMLVGRSPWATYWAVCQFLEDYIGVRWLIPGAIGEDVPRQATITVPVGKKTYSPVLLSRQWSGAHYGGDWNLRQRIHDRYKFHHNLINVFDVNKYWATHPEYFPIHGEKRYKPGKDDHAWQPCTGIDAMLTIF